VATMGMRAVLVFALLAGATAKDITVDLRHQYMSKVGRQEWIAQTTATQWK